MLNAFPGVAPFVLQQFSEEEVWGTLLLLPIHKHMKAWRSSATCLQSHGVVDPVFSSQQPVSGVGTHCP